jgi:hypothetical protein
MGDDYSRAIDLVTSGQGERDNAGTHNESLDAAPELFKALARTRPGYLKALLHTNAAAEIVLDLDLRGRSSTNWISGDRDWNVPH